MFNGKVIQDVAVEEALKEVSASAAAVAAKVPAADLPTEAGQYVLKVTVADEVVTYSWVALS